MSSTKQQQRVILITGGNKGIGFEVIKKLLADKSTSNNNLILLGSRDLKRGQDALVELGSPSNVHLLQLDTSSAESIAHATDEIKQKYGGQLDVLINNAAIANRQDTVEITRDTFATNYYGIKMVNKHLFPLIRENGRVVNVSSEVGAWALHDMVNEIQKKYKSATLTEEELDALVNDFISAVATKTLDKIVPKTKLPGLAYAASKTALTALTHIEARQWSGAKNVLVVAVCPGYCSTDLNNHGPGSRPAALGAESILYVVNTPKADLENGEFYQDGKKLPQSFECTMDFSKFQQHPEKKA
jgi:NAD(P)-dependent dehydrogenase (short-subunit alcohol dehydrogenase family)